jgi:hypothetical protein
MIDKVEVRIPAKAEFSREFGSLYRDIRGNPKADPFRGSRHYLYVGDLRKFGYEAILHMGCVRDKHGNHKLELLDTGAMSYAAMRNEIERIFKLDPRWLPLVRVDLAADVRSVPVSWFVAHVRARWKQWVCDIGHEHEAAEYARMGRREVQTLYFGKRPNCFRIYDKLAEYHCQYARLTRGASDATELPTFEEAYGYPESGIILTRVERQMGGGRVPAQIDTFGKLKRRLASFNPFERLEFLAVGTREPRIEDYGLVRWGFGKWLASCAEDIGVHRLRTLVNKHSGGHASRVFRDYAEFLPADDAALTQTELLERFRESVRKQLAA